MPASHVLSPCTARSPPPPPFPDSSPKGTLSCDGHADPHHHHHPPQALLANISALYAVYHGPEGLKTIADRVHGLACVFAAGAKKMGLEVGRGARGGAGGGGAWACHHSIS